MKGEVDLGGTRGKNTKGPEELAEAISLFFVWTCSVGLQVHRKPQFNQTVSFVYGEFYVHQLNLKMTVLNVIYLENQEHSLMTQSKQRV